MLVFKLSWICEVATYLRQDLLGALGSGNHATLDDHARRPRRATATVEAQALECASGKEQRQRLLPFFMSVSCDACKSVC